MPHSDLVIEALAVAEAVLLHRLPDMQRDRDAYRLLAQQAVHLLHHLNRENSELRAAHARLREEYRALREQGAAA